MMELFLLIVLFIGLVFASMQDIKSREISNWLNATLFSVGIFYQLMQSLTKDDYRYFVISLVLSAILFGFGSLLYYMKAFGGGDVKLLGAMGPYLVAFGGNTWLNAVLFVISLFVLGFFYSLIWSIVLVVKKPKGFLKAVKKLERKNWILAIVLIAFFVFMGLTIHLEGMGWFVAIGIVLVVSSLFLQAVEESHFKVYIHPNKLTEGDWLVESIKVGNRTIPLRASGLLRKDIEMLKKRGKEVFVKYGVPFAPAFLLAYFFMVFAFSTGLVLVLVQQLKVFS